MEMKGKKKTTDYFTLLMAFKDTLQLFTSDWPICYT